MPLEDGINESSTPEDFDVTWPTGGDPKSQGDDHLRNIKLIARNVFRSIFGLPIGLSNGSVPVHFNGAFGDSGLLVSAGRLNSTLAFANSDLFLIDPFTDLPSFVPATRWDDSGYLGTFTKVLDVHDNFVQQPLDSETNSAPIAFENVSPTNTISDSFVVKGAGTAVSRVRITIQANDVNGSILFQSATIGELIAGGGFTIAAAGTTTFVLSFPFTSIAGNTGYVTLDRYDPTSETMVTSGIFLKGATLGGFFIPYFELNGHLFETKTLALSEEIPAGDVFADSTTPIVVVGVASAQLHTITIPSAQISGTYEIISSLVVSTINATNLDLSATVNAVPVDRDGTGSLCQRNVDANIGQENSVTFPVSHTTGVDTVIVVTLSGLIAARTLTTASDYIRARRLT